ncbi:tumor necrosis factor receptor superfamily member 10B-like [Chanos chanos]|uniref:Tumor necrosis factor receptor superfamily member 10B-like n=1 Tax=Chanos chanos TaxID=29144 RepID=A0A6J2VMB3_CHACN|nr:tumor necrosis factor receptor superfamily member 10B-like [Chanos chanos]
MYAEVAMIGTLLVAYSVPCETTCGPGTFAIQNGIVEPDGSLHAFVCQRCSNCTELGRIELEHCTSYSDAKCGCEDGYIESTDNPERCVRGPTSPPEIFSGYMISQSTIM